MTQHSASCPVCGSSAVVLLMKRQSYLCEDCEHRWPAEPEIEQVAQGQPTKEASYSPQTDNVAETVIARYPFPIAWGYRHMVEADSASYAVDCAFYTYTSVLRLASLIFLAQFLKSDIQNPQAAKAVQSLRIPTLESWNSVLRTLVKYLFKPLPGKAYHFPQFAEGGPLSAGLAAAAWKLPKLKVNGLQVHNRLRNLRNERAHEPIWDEVECTRRLPEIRQLLDQVLSLFSALSKIELLRMSPRGQVSLTGAQDVFIESEIEDVRIEALFEDSPIVCQNTSGELLPLYPLFLHSDEPLAQGYIEPLLAFSGHGQKSALYLGVRNRLERRDTLLEYLDLLQAKNIDPGFTKKEFTPWGVSQWARESSLGTIENLTGVKYFPEFYQERCQQSASPRTETGEPEELTFGVDDVVRRWIDKGREAALIVAAEAGSGKTSLFCHLAEQLLGEAATESNLPDSAADQERSDCVLLLLGGAVRGETHLFERIRDGLGFSTMAELGVARFDELLTAWQEKARAMDSDQDQRRLVILLDAVNESDNPKRLFEELSELAAKAAVCNKHCGRPFVRLLASVRSERLVTLMDRWDQGGGSGHFLEHPHNFVHFTNHQGKELPWLSLRPFTVSECRRVYDTAASSLPAACPASWEDLWPATRNLLRHPLMLLLFHQTFAGNSHPPGVKAADGVWQAWLERSFSSRQGGSPYLEERVLALADICIARGYEQIPQELVAEWRQAWEEKIGNDPVRIAAGLDDLERLSEAGFLRQGDAEGLDWVSDSLAEQVFYRALCRRDPKLTMDSIGAWLKLLPTRPLDGALVHVGSDLFPDRPAELATFFTDYFRRSVSLMGTILIKAAPMGNEETIDDQLERFGKGLETLSEQCLAEDTLKTSLLLKNVLVLWDAGGHLETLLGATPVLKRIYLQALRLAENLVAIEPENKEYNRHLAISFILMSRLIEDSNPAKAREWYLKALEINQHLAAIEPENTMYQRDLSISFTELARIHMFSDPTKAREWCIKALEIWQHVATLTPKSTALECGLAISYSDMGDLDRNSDPAKAREWYLKALGIRERLVTMEPENTDHQRNLSLSYYSIGDLDDATDPAKAREWFLRALEIRLRLTELEPENSTYQRDLSVSYSRMGCIDKKRNPVQARAWHLEALAISQTLVDMEPENTRYQDDIACSFNDMGEMDEDSDMAKAREWYLKALEIRERLVTMEPENISYQRSLFVSLIKMGDLDKGRDPERALEWYLKALEISQMLADMEPENRTYQVDLSISLSRMGNMNKSSDPVKAYEWYLMSLEVCQRLSAMEPENKYYQRGLYYLFNKIGDLYEDSNPAKAREWYLKALEINQRLALHFNEADIHYQLAGIQSKLGRVKEALSAFAYALEIGYIDINYAAEDPDLRNIRDLSEFKDLIDRMRNNGKN